MGNGHMEPPVNRNWTENIPSLSFGSANGFCFLSVTIEQVFPSALSIAEQNQSWMNLDQMADISIIFDLSFCKRISGDPQLSIAK